jgi:CelD/BcsL family acetyltransferase involved in cellulose biosynthesis/predicted ATP-grasp superfamily ATP-dependent carboligase
VSGATPLTVLRNSVLAFDARADAAACRTEQISAASVTLNVSIHDEFAAVENLWRRFERVADCTPYQTLDWLAAWQRHVGVSDGTRPVIAVASFTNGEPAFLLPLAVEPCGATRRLCWLGQDLNDYNAPLLAKDFAQRVTPEHFAAAWREVRSRIQRAPALRHDWIELEKMPADVGGQTNPFCRLGVAANPSGAHSTGLSDDWKEFYVEKRSAATRRRDRSKRKRLAEFGEISFVTETDARDITRTLQTLMQQKHRLFAHRGIGDMFARSGWREFFLDIAVNAATRPMIHVSRVQIGEVCAAANLGLVFGGTYYHLLASYNDGALSHYGPGALHLRELLAYAIGRGLRRFDFTIGDEPYKCEWSDSDATLWDYRAVAAWRGWPAFGRAALARPLKRFIKQTPWVWRTVSHARALFGGLQHRAAPPPQSAAPGVLPNTRTTAPLACVMGDMDLVRPIVSAGIGCAVVSRPGSPSLHSRLVQARLPWTDFSGNADRLVEKLVDFARAQPAPPVLFYEDDAQLLLVSRFRDRLAPALRFVIADAELVEDLVDKARFQDLAERHGLPVPPARRFHPATQDPDTLALRFPIVLKPLTRLVRWNDNAGLQKAFAAKDAQALRALWPQLVALDVELLAQELIPGAETQIESYHCYVDRGGGIVAEFTGRKIRTYPAALGHSTALQITDAADVRRQGRAIAEQIGLTGVAKFDFKRDAAGALHLLEINPRFTLWHHPAAVAGLNIPALVYADLTGMPRPPVRPARPGVRWCRAWTDFAAARATGMPLGAWLAWTWRCEAKSTLSWDDPLALPRATWHRLVGRRFGTGANDADWVVP